MTIENQNSDFKIKLLNSKSNLSLHIGNQPAPTHREPPPASSVRLGGRGPGASGLRVEQARAGQARLGQGRAGKRPEKGQREARKGGIRARKRAPFVGAPLWVC